MSPRTRFNVYLVALHLALAGLALTLALDRAGGEGATFWTRAFLPLAEIAFAASLALGTVLLGRVFRPFALLRDSARLLAEHDFSTRLRPVGQPEVDGLVGVYNRMADSLREERVKQQEQQNFLRQVLDSSPSGIAILDFDERVSYANHAAARLLAAEGDALAGRRLADLPSPLAQAATALTPGTSVVAAATGGRRVRCASGSFLDRGFSRRFVLFEELTEELRRYERLAYEKLIRMLSHEVNNSAGAASSLLHSCLNYAPQIAEADRADYENALEVVIARTEQLSRFMKGFAEVVRLPAPRKAPCDVRRMLEDSVTLFSRDAEARGIAWRWEGETDLPPVALDRPQMEQVFVNVLKNAIEAVGRKGTITLRFARRGERVALEIEDTGEGLSAEARSNLFTPFFTTKEGGQGVGLTLVQEVLSQHGCEYSLDGPPGGPTRFTIVF